MWLDEYRLENAYSLKQAAYSAARDAAFVVLVVTPKYVVSPARCLELLAALRRPREQVLVWIVPTSEWLSASLVMGDESGIDTRQHVEHWFEVM